MPAFSPIEGPEEVSTRFEARAAALGFAPPPAPVQLRFEMRGDRCEVHFVGEDGTARQLLAWIAAFRPRTVRFPRHDHDPELWAEFQPLPAGWRAWAGRVRWAEVELNVAGDAVVRLRGERAEVRAVVDAQRRSGGARVLSVQGVPAEDAAVLPAPSPPLLTPRQSEALALALQHGYYDIPRRVDLKALAKRMGISAPSAWELIRRAESRVMSAYGPRAVDAAVEAAEREGPRARTATWPPVSPRGGSDARRQAGPRGPGDGSGGERVDDAEGDAGEGTSEETSEQAEEEGVVAGASADAAAIGKGDGAAPSGEEDGHDPGERGSQARGMPSTPRP